MFSKFGGYWLSQIIEKDLVDIEWVEPLRERMKNFEVKQMFFKWNKSEGQREHRNKLLMLLSKLRVCATWN